MHDINDKFGRAVELFLESADSCRNSQLYVNDAVEFTSLWLGELADRHYERALKLKDTPQAEEELAQTVELLSVADSLLASHPNHLLSRWVDNARLWGEGQIADHYESDAKRLITTWGGWQEDYAARFWAGLIKDYYIPRIEIWFSDKSESLNLWEESWIATPWTDTSVPYEDPITAAKAAVANAK